MSRSGYGYNYDDADLILYRAKVERAMSSKRGQKFLKKLLAEMDAMKVKELVSGELEADGRCCAIGLMTRKRRIDVMWSDEGDCDNARYVARKLNIAECLAREVVFENDEKDIDFCISYTTTSFVEAPAERWERMRRWVSSCIR